MKSLEEKFRNSKRTHSFLDNIAVIKTAPKSTAQTVPLRNRPSASALHPPKPVRAPIEVLEGLRQDWLTQESTPTPKTEAKSPSARKQRPKRPTTVANYTPFLESLKASIRRRLSSPTEGRNARERQGRSTAVVAAAMLAGVAIMILIGALLYSTTVSSIFNPTTLSTAPQSDSPAAADVPIAGQTTQPAALGATVPDPASATDSAPTTIVTDTDSPAPSLFEPARLNLDPATAPKAAAAASTPRPDQAAAESIQAFGTTSVSSLAAGSSNPAIPPAAGRTPTLAPPPATRAARAASYLTLVRAAQSSLQRNDLQGAFQSAASAKALDPQSLPALELMQTVLARAGDPHNAEISALDAIAHGGKAVFKLQHLHASPATQHSASIIITATTLAFVPEGPCTLAGFTIPRSSITAVQLRPGSPGLPTLNILFESSGSSNAPAAKGELSFRNANPAQQTALLSAIRNVLLAPKVRS